MFGYLRPVQGELKVYELERFKACYCGLCRALGRNYGQVARFVLSYELVFLSMLLWDNAAPLEIKRRRCIASPLRRKRYCTSNPAIADCSGYNVILSWWKLQDSIMDATFFKSIPYRALALLLRRAYKKASREHSQFDAIAKQSLSELSEFEQNPGAAIRHDTQPAAALLSAKQEDTAPRARDAAITAVTLDMAADKFAKILMTAASGIAEDTTRRPMSELLYHLGRWIYIVDACDDYYDDISSGRYNPVVVKFPPENGAMPEAGKARVNATLTHSSNLVCSAFELLPENVWSQTVRNTIYLGMPDVSARVLSGAWPPKEAKGNTIYE